VSYLTVVLAVLVPAIGYYISLFAMIMFESRKLGLHAQIDDAAVPRPTLQDWLNMLLVFGPLVLIVVLLGIGFSASGSSVAALALLLPLSFINPEIRRQPAKLLYALANGGETFARLLMAIAAVSIVVSTLSATGMPVKFGVLLANALGHSLLVALLLVAGGCILLGMGMPTLPAYVTVAAIALPSMQQLGLAPLTAHMFVFFIAVASAITPPVAIASYAAAAISGGKPIATAVESSRLGLMIFIIPFAFAYKPLLLTVGDAGATFELGAWLFVLFELLLGIYLIGSVLTRYDRYALGWAGIALRLVAAVLLFVPSTTLSWVGIALAAVVLFLHHRPAASRQALASSHAK